ncbi:MAG: Dabb family protein [Burkholderiaceae bacterium]
MFYHTVLLDLRDPSPEFIEQLNDYAARMQAELPYVRDYYFGPNLASRAAQFKWTVVATFDSEADHERYQVSDIHQQMKAFLTPQIAEIVVSDVETRQPGA